MHPFLSRVFLVILICTHFFGCYALQRSSGGGQTDFNPPREVDPADIALPDGFQAEVVATGLTFPTGVGFDDEGGVYVVEAGYSYGEVWTTPQLLRIDPDGDGFTVVAAGGDNGPWTGVDFHNGAFYVAEGGELEGGRIVRITKDGKMTALVSNLPSRGDHHTNGPETGPDGRLYFGIGTATNSAVVGIDNYKFGWLQRYPDFHDTPCRDITLTGENFTTKNPFEPESDEKMVTGAFVPFGEKTCPGQVIQGAVPCNGAILRIQPEGGNPELVAWGFRNPFAFAFSPDGRLFTTENQYDIRGSRPIFGAGDLLWEVSPGTWYGWPDYHGNTLLTKHSRYQPPGKPKPPILIQDHPDTPPEPVAVLGVHSSSNGFDFSRNPDFGYVGDAFIAQFGDQAPTTGKVLAPVGFKVIRVRVDDGTVKDFAVNKGKKGGPASWTGGNGLERPMDAKFDPEGAALYIVDFGVMMQSKQGANPVPETGVLWRVTKR
ncbi:MAG: PQQ-dependent sugar dehydrogenase [Desulfococcaceae bacterium]